MDIKTLEYMGERVDKARILQSKIKEVNTKITMLETRTLETVSFQFQDNSFYDAAFNITGEIKAAALNTYINRRDSLQKELDEL